VVRDWAHHSITSFCDIKKGEKLTLSNLIERRPRTMMQDGKKKEGIPAKFLDPAYSTKIIGHRANRNIPKDTMFTWEDVV